MAKTKKRAWVKYANGVLVSSVLLIRNNRPPGAGWQEIPFEQCCPGNVEIVPTT